MSREPDVRTADDVLPWIHAHKALSHAHWEQQRRDNNELRFRQGKLEERLASLEQRVARWSAVSALIGGTLGAGVVQLLRAVL